MAELFVYERGKGIPVILLHGFPFTNKVWDSFAEKLATQFHVFTPDLPGFGKSELPSETLTIDLVAEKIIAWLKDKKIHNSILIGHSLGGYVALAMAAKASDLFSGIGLFHSTAYADSQEKKESRNKVLEFIDKNGVKSFTSNFIGPLFADQNHPGISVIRSIATEATGPSVKAYTLAMRDRSDRTDVLKKFPKPVLFIAGEKDGGIPIETIKTQAKLNSLSEVHVLASVAHMGMVESENHTLEIVQDFIKNNGVTS
jgi:pimeloyl-ACP methyl ester carboxylesterase